MHACEPPRVRLQNVIKHVKAVIEVLFGSDYKQVLALQLIFHYLLCSLLLIDSTTAQATRSSLDRKKKEARRDVRFAHSVAEFRNRRCMSPPAMQKKGVKRKCTKGKELLIVALSLQKKYGGYV